MLALTVRPELVEGLYFLLSLSFSRQKGERQGFDKLSPNGIVEARHHIPHLALSPSAC
jgi:hypothetical protein